MNGAADASVSARGSSFNAAMRILPRPRREAMFEIYSFCRAVDDIADEAGPRQARKAALAKWRSDIDALYAGQPAPEQAPASLRGLARAIHAFGLRREDFHAIIDGMEMDVEEDIQAPDLATLDLYCDRVASAVGRLSVKVFGLPQPDGHLLAHHLGRALQLTNILRDLDEDAAIGRLYLPREDLSAAGIDVREPRAVSLIRLWAKPARRPLRGRRAISVRRRSDHGAMFARRACARPESWAKSIRPFSSA